MQSEGHSVSPVCPACLCLSCLPLREEIESFQRLGVYEEVPKGSATSTPLPARLILVSRDQAKHSWWACKEEGQNCHLWKFSTSASR